VVGTRPEAIKMAPVIKAFGADPRLESIVCSSGQHRQMLDSVFALFDIVPDVDLAVMTEGQDLTDVTSRVLTMLRDVLRQYKPSLVIAQGDTTTTMAAALGAYYVRIPFWHIEAGLRSGNKYSPWPEEVNRKIATAIADVHCAPTELARANLLAEKVDDRSIIVTGNTVVDALLGVRDGILRDAAFVAQLESKYPFLDAKASQGEDLVLVTGHRRESFGEGFGRMCEALRRVAENPRVRIVYPVHLNPNVREPVFRILGGLRNVELLEPLDYRPFVYFMHRAKIIITDSGGIQEEAPSLGKPVLVMRDVTERQEGVEAGVVALVGTDPDQIVSSARRLLEDAAAYSRMSTACNPYGDGNASRRILDAVFERGLWGAR